MIEVNSKELEQLKSEGKKILVDLYSQWCAPCKQLIPILENIEKDHDTVTFLKMNVDKNTEFCVSLGIRSVPTVIIFNGLEIIDRSQGAKSGTYYTTILENS